MLPVGDYSITSHVACHWLFYYFTCYLSVTIRLLHMLPFSDYSITSHVTFQWLFYYFTCYLLVTILLLHMLPFSDYSITSHVTCQWLFYYFTCYLSVTILLLHMLPGSDYSITSHVTWQWYSISRFGEHLFKFYVRNADTELISFFHVPRSQAAAPKTTVKSWRLELCTHWTSDDWQRRNYSLVILLSGLWCRCICTWYKIDSRNKPNLDSFIIYL